MSSSTFPIISARATGENTEHPKDWDRAAKAQWYEWVEVEFVQPAQQIVAGMTIVAMFVAPEALPVFAVFDVAVGAFSMWVNAQQGDVTGMAWDVVGVAFGVAPAFKGAFTWLRGGDDIARGGCTMLNRLIGGGCFRGITGVHGIGLELDDGALAWNPTAPLPVDETSQLVLAPPG